MARRASSAYHLSEKGDYVFYIAQAQFARELFVKHEGKASKLLGTKARIIHVSPTADLCSKHGVQLVEWMFHEPVTKVILQQKMKEAKKIIEHHRLN